MRPPGRRRRLPAALLACLVGLVAAALAPPPGRAGAWTRAPGEGQAIVSVGRRAQPMSGLLGGAGEAETDATTAQVYLEYGLAEGLTVGGKLYLDVQADDDDGSAALGAFVRRRLWQSDDGAVAAVQLEAAVPVERLIDDGFAESKPYSTAELGLRGLYGRSWWGDWGSAFLSTDAGVTARAEGQAPDIRLEATVGYQPGERLLGMLTVRSLTPLRDTGTDPQLKLQPSVAWHLRRGDADGGGRTSLQLGAGYDLLNPDDGLGLFIGVWQSF